MYNEFRVKRQQHLNILLAEPGFLLAVYKAGGFIAGGYAMTLAMETSREYGDVDIFCRDETSFENVCNALLNRGLVLGDDTYSARSFHVAALHGSGYAKLSVIKPILDHQDRTRFGTPAHVVAQFDFTGIACWYDFDTDEVIWLDWAHYTDACAKMINILHERPAAQVWVRSMKYVRKGWNMHISVMNYIAVNWDKTYYLAFQNRTDADLQAGVDSA